MASVDWRAVQHLPDLPSGSEPVDAELASSLARELERIRALLVAAELFPARVPDDRPNRAVATTALAAATDQREPLRGVIFRAHWFDGLDIADPATLAGLHVRPVTDPPPIMAHWQRAWKQLDRPLTPMMERPDGTVSRGVEVLEDLAELLAPDT